METICYIVKLVSAQGVITLPEMFHNLNKVKINKLVYRFTLENEYVLTIHFAGSEKNKFINDNLNYTFSILNGGNKNMLFNLNYSTEPTYDVIFKDNRDTTEIAYTIRTDGNYANVTQSNPMYMEIKLSN